MTAVPGVIHGGWSFVVAAYAVSAVVLLGYAISVHSRYRAERDRARRDVDRGGSLR
jgi:acyl-coenzyme A thioesterase PaaI-like protein